MKIKTAIKNIISPGLVIFFIIISFNFVFGQQQVPVFYDDVVVGAKIDQDFFSTVTLIPNTVELSQGSTVEIRIVSSTGAVIPNHNIVIIAPNLGITQPVSVTDLNGKTTGTVFTNVAGSYAVCAKDTTYGFDIAIHNCATLNVVPVAVPTLLPEPQYTKGTTNTLHWNPLGTGYLYSIQASTNSDFTNIIHGSTWVGGTNYDFNNLINEQIYFYRVRVRNISGGFSDWSSSVFSVQDSEAPTIALVQQGEVGENTTTSWKNGYVVNMGFLVKDNLFLNSVKFYCVKRDGTMKECATLVVQGDSFTYSFDLKDLERQYGVYLYPQYNFCIVATDGAGNEKKECNITLNVPVGTVKPGDTPPTVVERIEKGLDDIGSVVEDIVKDTDKGKLETVTKTASIVTITTGFLALASSLWELPYLLLQGLLTFLSWFGFRKKARPVGFVYNSITKEPVPQAIVRVFNSNGKMVWSDVTDSNGDFDAELEDGKYTIVVRNSRFKYPSNIVFGSEDYPLENVYHGEVFDVVKGNPITFAIPVDPLEVSMFRRIVEGIWGRFKFVLNILHLLLFVGGLVLSIYLYSTYGGWLNFIVILLFIPSFFLLVRNIFNRKPKYGVIRDTDGNRLGDIVVGLREVEFEKLIAKRVTGKDGKYRFFINEGRYDIEILETGYRVEDIKEGENVEADKGNYLVARDITLSKI